MNGLRRMGLARSAGLVAAVTASSFLLGRQSGAVFAGTPESVSFGAVSDLLDRRCTACHNTEGAPGAADLDLEAGKSYAMLMRRSTESPLALVEPGLPEKSYLMAKLLGNQMKAGGSGDRMPAGQGMLAPVELEIVRKWILSGAQP